MLTRAQQTSISLKDVLEGLRLGLIPDGDLTDDRSFPSTAAIR